MNLEEHRVVLLSVMKEGENKKEKNERSKCRLVATLDILTLVTDVSEKGKKELRRNRNRTNAMYHATPLKSAARLDSTPLIPSEPVLEKWRNESIGKPHSNFIIGE